MSEDTDLEFIENRPDHTEAASAGKEKLRRVARYQRTVIVALIVQLVVYIIATSSRQLPLPALLGLLLLMLCVIAIAVASVFFLTRELHGVGRAVVCAVLMFVPCVSLITLLIVNQGATKFLQGHGVQVGFFGVDPSRIQ